MDNAFTIISLILLILFFGFIPFLIANDVLTDEGRKKSTGKTILAFIIVLAIMLIMFSSTPGWNRIFS